MHRNNLYYSKGPIDEWYISQQWRVPMDWRKILWVFPYIGPLRSRCQWEKMKKGSWQIEKVEARMPLEWFPTNKSSECMVPAFWSTKHLIDFMSASTLPYSCDGPIFPVAKICLYCFSSREESAETTYSSSTKEDSILPFW